MTQPTYQLYPLGGRAADIETATILRNKILATLPAQIEAGIAMMTAKGTPITEEAAALVRALPERLARLQDAAWWIKNGQHLVQLSLATLN